LIAIDQELMGTLRYACKTNQMYILPPGVTVGSRNNCQQTKDISKILTCGIAYLVKRKKNLMSVRACRSKMQMKGMDINKTMFTPNSKIHAYKVVAKLLHRHEDLLTKGKMPCLSQG
jgi:hypothetical protein